MNNTGRCSIHVDGEQIELLFGMPAVEFITKKVEEGSMVLDDDGNTIGNSSIAFLLHAGYWNYCIANGRTPKKKVGDFFDAIEDMVDTEDGQRDLILVAETYRDSKSTRKQMERIEKQVEDIKKKTAELSGKTLNPSVTENSGSAQSSTAD